MFKRFWVSLFIPKGLYCYKTVTLISATKTNPPILKTKLCRYYKNKRCELIKDVEEDILLWDKVKACGIKENTGKV
jgi:hypothetical protein